MPDRHQALMRTRCPACNTFFRVTSDQLRAKAGKVRCGYCKGIFNALDQLIDDAPAASPLPTETPAPAAESGAPESELESGPAAKHRVTADPETALEAAAQSAETGPVAEPLREPESTEADRAVDCEIVAATTSTAIEPEPETETVVLPGENREDSLVAAREAGLMAARELTEIPAYNRWAAGALIGNTSGGFGSKPDPRAKWPFAAALLLLLAALLGQLVYYFRSDLVRHVHAVGEVFDALGVAVPLPAQSDLVSIEGSDLQVDNASGLLVMQATLRNQAPYAQAWPVLELTLTDAHDAAVARRILTAPDYLPPGSDLNAFPGNAETPVHLWIEAKGLGATGYRLYIFYP